jgi:hypothetical protein
MPSPKPQSVEAYVAACLGCMQDEINMITAGSMAKAGGTRGSGHGAAKPVAPPAPAAGSGPADEGGPGADADAEADADAVLPPAVMLRRRPEASVELYDPPADVPIALPEALLQEPGEQSVRLLDDAAPAKGIGTVAVAPQQDVGTPSYRDLINRALASAMEAQAAAAVGGRSSDEELLLGVARLLPAGPVASILPGLMPPAAGKFPPQGSRVLKVRLLSWVVVCLHPRPHGPQQCSTQA